MKASQNDQSAPFPIERVVSLQVSFPVTAFTVKKQSVKPYLTSVPMTFSVMQIIKPVISFLLSCFVQSLYYRVPSNNRFLMRETLGFVSRFGRDTDLFLCFKGMFRLLKYR